MIGLVSSQIEDKIDTRRSGSTVARIYRGEAVPVNGLSSREDAIGGSAV